YVVLHEFKFKKPAGAEYESMKNHFLVDLVANSVTSSSPQQGIPEGTYSDAETKVKGLGKKEIEAFKLDPKLEGYSVYVQGNLKLLDKSEKTFLLRMDIEGVMPLDVVRTADGMIKV